MAHQGSIRCLILACGNTLRSDDGVGPWLAAWAEERFRANPDVRVISRQQWTPELAEEIARSEAVLFIDSSLESDPGSIRFAPVALHMEDCGCATHAMGPLELLALTRSLYRSLSAHAMLLTVGAGSTELGESFSAPVEAALPRARRVLEKAVLRFLQR